MRTLANHFAVQQLSAAGYELDEGHQKVEPNITVEGNMDTLYGSMVT